MKLAHETTPTLPQHTIGRVNAGSEVDMGYRKMSRDKDNASREGKRIVYGDGKEGLSVVGEVET